MATCRGSAPARPGRGRGLRGMRTTSRFGILPRFGTAAGRTPPSSADEQGKTKMAAQQADVSRLTGTSSSGALPVDVRSAFLAVPQPEHVAGAPGLGRVPERRAAVGDLAVVEVLELALLDAELHPALPGVHDFAEGREGIGALRVERLRGEPLAVLDVVVVVARGERPAVGGEDGMGGPPRLVVAVLGLAIPPKRRVEPRQ